jgi:NAD(P)-dependent dehydrogenase (short-subunit alcohol dehydrogenase family)
MRCNILTQLHGTTYPHRVNRFAVAVEMAGAILYLSPDDASYQTGGLMVVDDGYSVGLPVPGVLDEPPVSGAVR